MKKGSITPFCAMSLMIVASLLLALLESARVYGLERYAQWKADAAIDSLCAEYQPVLWQQYGLLFLDGACGTPNFSQGYVLERMETYMEKSCKDSASGWGNFVGLDLFAMTKGEVALEGYALATDEQGELFLTYVAEREKENLPLSVAWDSYQAYQERSDLVWQCGDVEESIAEACRVINEVKSEWIKKWEISKETDEKEDESKEVQNEVELPDTSGLEQILNSASSMLSKGILDVIYGDLSQVATKDSKPISDLISRKKTMGNMHLQTDNEWYRKMLVLSYLERYFSNYINPKAKHFLTYEMEYVLCGKHTEWENLAETLKKMLLVREAANIAYLLQDKEKMQMVEGLAGVIGVMAGGNAAVIKAVETGIVGAWAYMESVLDVRSLVAGEKISIIKQETEWTSDLSEIFTVFEGDARAKPCENGLGYVEYLKQFLYGMEKQKLAYRMMEVMEMGMRSQGAYVNAQMDHMLIMLRCKLLFESKPVFSSLISIGEVYRDNYCFVKKVERSYIP